jgi:hypothetical protein
MLTWAPSLKGPDPPEGAGYRNIGLRCVKYSTQAGVIGKNYERRPARSMQRKMPQRLRQPARHALSRRPCQQVREIVTIPCA